MNHSKLPILPLRDIVVFPHMIAPLFVGRKPSVNALNNVMLKDKRILLVTQKNSEIDNPKADNLYRIGTLAKVLQLLKLPDGTIKVLVEGVERVKIEKINITSDFLVADYSPLGDFGRDIEFCKTLIKDAGVGAVPFSAFYQKGINDGLNNFIRFCYCKKNDTLDTAINRLEKYFAAN